MTLTTNHPSTRDDAVAGPLTGIRVLDISTVYAAPITAMLLGDYASAFHDLAVKCCVWTVKSAFDLGESGLRSPDETHVERHFSRE